MKGVRMMNRGLASAAAILVISSMIHKRFGF